MTLLGIWIGAFLTLCIFSFLYKDNPFFRFAESLFAGVSLGYYIGNETNQTIKPNLIVPLVHDFRANAHLLIPALIGINLYTRYIPKIAWWGRASLAIYIGYYVAVNMVQKLHGDVLPQMESTVVPLGVSGASLGPSGVIIFALACLALLACLYFSSREKTALGAGVFVGAWIVLRAITLAAGSRPIQLALDNLLLFVGVLAVLVYFFFSLEHRGVVGGVSRLGIWFLMLGFGAAFGYTVMGRVSLLIGRLNFLVVDWFRGTLHQIL